MRKKKKSAPAEMEVEFAEPAQQSQSSRLQKLNRDSFTKKGFKSLQWFISKDFE